MNRPSFDILVVAPNWLGDAVMCLPLIGWLAATPGVRVRVLASPYSARVFWGVEGVDELVVMPKSGRARGLWERRRTIRGLSVVGGIVLPPSFSSALALAMAGVPIRVGYAADGRSLLLTRSVGGKGCRKQHLTENYLRLGRELLAALHVDAPDRHAIPRVRVLAEERRDARRVLDAASVGRDYALVVPGATFGPTKCWPQDKYRRLVQELAAEVPVVLAGSSSESELCRAIARDVANTCNLAGRTTLGELFALIESACVLVANDSGTPHIAGSLGTPAVVIFGSTSPEWTKPLGDAVTVIHEALHCSPCFLSRCPTQLECYESIRPERVLGATRHAMKKTVENLNWGC